MHAFKRNLIAIALGAVFVTPLAFAQSGQAAGKATADSVKTDTTPASPTLPTQADPRASDAISERTTDRESNTATTATDTSGTAQGATGDGAMTSQKSTNPGKGNWWKDADSDGDGKLSTTEANANAGLSSRFSEIDADADGFVTTEEYRTYFTANASQGAEHAAGHSAVVARETWVKLDADADSRISVSEAAADTELKASFATMDSNGDGFVTQAEYSAHAKARK